MYKHAKAPVLIGERPRQTFARNSASNLSLLISSIKFSGVAKSERHVKLAEGRRVLVNLGVSKFGELPEIIFLALDPVGAYRTWCRITGILDETRGGKIDKRALLNELAKIDKKEAAERLRIEETKRAKNLRKKVKKEQRNAGIKVSIKPNVLKGKTKAAKLKETVAEDIYSVGRRLPGSGFSKK